MKLLGKNLENDASYEVKVRSQPNGDYFKGTWSEWSASRSFRTAREQHSRESCKSKNLFGPPGRKQIMGSSAPWPALVAAVTRAWGGKSLRPQQGQPSQALGTSAEMTQKVAVSLWSGAESPCEVKPHSRAIRSDEVLL